MSDPTQTEPTPQGPEGEAPAPASPEPATSNEIVLEVPSSVGELLQEEPGSFPTPVLFVVVLAGAVSYALFRLARLRVAERVKRWMPIAHVGVWAVTFLLAAALSIRHASTEWLIFGLVLVFVIVALNLNWLRSVLAGVTLTLEHHLEVGDSVRVEDLEGDITHFGLRATRIRAIDGTLHDIPNEDLLTQHVANLSGDGSDSACQILIAVPPGVTAREASEIALRAAILSPLASPRHRPEVFLRERADLDAPLQLHVRGYAFDPSYQDHFRSDVLERVMQRFAALEPGGRILIELAHQGVGGDVDDVARHEPDVLLSALDDVLGGDLDLDQRAIDDALEARLVALGARLEAAGLGDGVHDRGVGAVGEGAGGLDLAEDEDALGVVLQNRARDAGVGQVPVTQARGDGVLDVQAGLVADVDAPDVWVADGTGRRDCKLSRERLLVEDLNGDLVARPQVLCNGDIIMSSEQLIIERIGLLTVTPRDGGEEDPARHEEAGQLEWRGVHEAAVWPGAEWPE